MKNRWNPQEAANLGGSELSLRAYTSRLLGQEEDLVLHGGGNTSVKLTGENLFGEPEELLYVKGSGWDLRTIEEAGFAPTRLRYLQRLAELETLGDGEMMRQLRLSLLDPTAPTPSVEAILHAIIALRYVDHTHADALVALSNTPGGEAAVKALFGDEVLVLPYIMPGFALARQVYRATRDTDWSRLRGIFLMHHGLFTFADEARASYEAMIELVSRAEARLEEQGCQAAVARAPSRPREEDYLSLARQRRAVSRLAGRPMLACWLQDEQAAGFASLENVAEIATRGPLTPDHTLLTKPVPAILDSDPETGIEQFARDYRAYFARHDTGSLTCLDPAPRFAVWRRRGVVCFASNAGRLSAVGDIARHTVRAVQWGEHLGGWQALPEADLFAVEYWELEQAKLKKTGSGPPLEGRVVLVSGAASGIGKACVEEFTEQGACVIALDIREEVRSLFDPARTLSQVCDVRDAAGVTESLRAGIARFGGLDILISNAGGFPPSRGLDEMDEALWQESLEVNLNAHRRLLGTALPFLEAGLDPSVVFMGSKNVPAPGPGAAAYSSAKAALTQMARVAALELGDKGIRVNVLHPNAVFDTGVWTQDTLEERAGRYNLTVEEYKCANVLGVEVSSRHVARAARSLAGPDFVRTTGAQVPVDGGNDRVI